MVAISNKKALVNPINENLNISMSLETRLFLIEQLYSNIASLKKVVLLLDENHPNAIAHISLYEKLKEGKENYLTTCCTSVFSSATLDKGYDVIAIKADGSHVILSELFDPSQTYTRRIIRRGHNLERFLLTNEFKFALL